MMNVNSQPPAFTEGQSKPGVGPGPIPEFPFDQLFGTAQAVLQKVVVSVTTESMSVQEIETDKNITPQQSAGSVQEKTERTSDPDSRDAKSRSSEWPTASALDAIAKWIQTNPAGLIHGLGAILMQNIRQVAKAQVVPNQPVPTFRFEVTEAFSDPLQIDIRKDAEGYKVILASSGELQTLLGQNMNALAVFLAERLPQDRIRLVLEEKEQQDHPSDSRQGQDQGGRKPQNRSVFTLEESDA
ncbi:MAG: hypothetical protein AAB066_00520 [Candidatus Margulisiibacteriota bacterium]